MTYENITLTFDIHPFGMSTGSDQCIFSYSTDNSISSWTSFYQINDNNAHIIGHTETLNIETENNIGISIKIEAISGSSKCCLLSNIILQGNTISASNDFIIPPTSNKLSYFNANTLCSNTYGTTLATIPTFNLNKKAVAICRDFCTMKGQTVSNCACWNGLYRNANQNQWHWQDGTSVQNGFGFDNNANAIPFAAPWWTDGSTGTDPNVAISSVAYVRIGQVASTWAWGDTGSSSSYYPLCNAPPTATPTISPITSIPTTNEPTTNGPTTFEPTTFIPTTIQPTTTEPTTFGPTTSMPTTVQPTVLQPTTTEPSTVQPSTVEPSSMQPSSIPTNIPTISPIGEHGGQVEEMTSTYTIYVSRNELKNKDKNKEFTLIFFIVGMVIVLCICLIIVFVYKKMKDRKERIKQAKRMQMSVINNRSTSKTFTTDINTRNKNTNTISNTNMIRINSVSNTLNVQTLTPSQVSVLAQGEFNVNLTNSAGINNLLMNDIVDDMNNNNNIENNDDMIIQGMTTTGGGPSIDGNNTEDEIMNTDTNSTGDISDDDENVITNQINNVTIGGPNMYINHENNVQEGNDEYEYDEQYNDEYEHGNRYETKGNVNIDGDVDYIDTNEDIPPPPPPPLGNNSDDELLDYVNVTKN
eukprot:73537_1